LAIPKFLEDLNIISRIGNKPGSDSGLTTDQFKAKFDEGILKIQTYINERLIPGIEGAVSEEGLLSQINTVLGKKLDKSGGTITGDLNMNANINMNGNSVSGLASPVNGADAVPKSYADTKRIEKTLLFSGWSDSAPFAQTITVEGLSDKAFARVYPVYPATLAEKLELAEETAKVRNCTRSGNTMTFECWEEKPVKDIPIVVEVYV
jgi:hypothetical protein